jgi:hypothetical protein
LEIQSLNVDLDAENSDNEDSTLLKKTKSNSSTSVFSQSDLEVEKKDTLDDDLVNILNMQLNAKELLEYLVHWKDNGEDTWENVDYVMMGHTEKVWNFHIGNIYIYFHLKIDLFADNEIVWKKSKLERHKRVFFNQLAFLFC